MKKIYRIARIIKRKLFAIGGEEDLLDPLGYPARNEEFAALEPEEESVPEEQPEDKARLMEGVTLFHADHGIGDDQLKYIVDQLREKVAEGFFIQQIQLSDQVPCGLYGPEMGDPPVGDDEVEMVSRSADRPWKDRMIDKPMRPVDYVQAIGTKAGDELTIYTIYGGPLAPQNPDDPDNHDAEGAKKFWSEHALSKG